MLGLHDLQAGVYDTVAALLVQVGHPRLAQAGLTIPSLPAGRDAELRLYARLVADGAPDPYGAYNALLRRLVSCEAALEQGSTVRA